MLQVEHRGLDGVRPRAEAAERDGRPGRVSDARAISIAIRLLRRVPRPLGGFEAAEIMAARTSDLRLLPRAPKAFTIRAAEAGDAPLLERFSGDRNRTPRRPEPGDDCLLAVAEGRLQAVEWVRWGPAEYGDDRRRLGVRFRIPDRCCWLHDGGNASGEVVGPWGMLMGRLRTFLEPRGVETIFLQIDPDDSYSVACHESLGFRRAGRLAALRMRNRHLVGFRPEGGGWARVAGGELDLARLRV